MSKHRMVGATHRQGSTHSGRRLPWQRPHAHRCECEACRSARGMRARLTASALSPAEREALAVRCAAASDAASALEIARLALRTPDEIPGSEGR